MINILPLPEVRCEINPICQHFLVHCKLACRQIFAGCVGTHRTAQLAGIVERLITLY